jgi:hypothetical protein
MRFRYSTTDSTQSELDSLPRLPFVLRYGKQVINVVGLVDSGATVNVLPYRLGIQLGAVWDDRKATIRLAGNLGNVAAQPLFPMAEIGDFPPVRLAFAWSQSDDVPLILGQMSFFMEFDICFYRSQLEFEVKPKSR